MSAGDKSIYLTCVTATYNAVSAGNRERLIRCVESVSALKIEHEHLIYDGASTDETTEILRALEVKTPRLKIKSEPDTGIYNALNKGVRDAVGEWFYVLGCDDEIVDCAALAAALELGERQKADIVVSPVYTSKDLKDVARVRRDRILCGTPYPHQGFLIRTECLRDLSGFDESYAIAADYDLMLRALYRHSPDRVKIAFCSRAFAFYSYQGASSNVGLCYDEYARALSSAFSIGREEAANVCAKRPGSLLFILRSLTHGSPEIRRSGFYLFLRYLAGNMGLFGPDGALRWRKVCDGRSGKKEDHS